MVRSAPLDGNPVDSDGSKGRGLRTTRGTRTMLVVACAMFLAWYAFLRSVNRKKSEAKKRICFFHPFARDGGGGERVLWCAMDALQSEDPEVEIHLYTGDTVDEEELRSRAMEVFGVRLERSIRVVRLRLRRLVEAETYPRFTMLGQAFGSIVLGLEAMWRFTPGMFIDTSGYAFTYPLAKMMGSKVVAYVHYPTISTDMLERVRGRKNMYNNEEAVAKSAWKSIVKLYYYRFFAMMYGMVGSFADVTMVNSNWTRNHICKLWKGQDVVVVYPPCDTSGLEKLDLDQPRKLEVISVAQFRPEKDHRLQIESFALALSMAKQSRETERLDKMRLRLVGSCRNRSDEQRVQDLRILCRDLGIEDRVDFCLGIPYQELKTYLGTAICGIHTMLDEHFGIGVVEYMAAGTIPIAHKSGGPLCDIVVRHNGIQTGYLATTREEFAAAILEVLSMDSSTRLSIARAARAHASTFSTARFISSWSDAIRPVLSKIDVH